MNFSLLAFLNTNPCHIYMYIANSNYNCIALYEFLGKNICFSVSILPTMHAMLQGGPCKVLAAVQACVLQELLFVISIMIICYREAHVVCWQQFRPVFYKSCCLKIAKFNHLDSKQVFFLLPNFAILEYCSQLCDMKSLKHGELCSCFLYPIIAFSDNIFAWDIVLWFHLQF